MSRATTPKQVEARGWRRFFNWDRIGIGLSSVCVVHCLALPVGLAMLPLWPVTAGMHTWLHVMFAVVIIPTTLVAMWYGYRRHGSFGTLSLLGAGLLVILAALLVEQHSRGWLTETSITLAGSSLLIIGHWRNWRVTGSCGLHGIQDQEAE